MSRYNKYGKISQDGRHYSTVTYPVVEKNNYQYIVIMTNATDRLDLLAKKYFNNSKLWWLLALVNQLPGDSVMVQPGIQLYIPKDYFSYVR